MIHDLETLPNHTTLISNIPANVNVSSLEELTLTVESATLSPGNSDERFVEEGKFKTKGGVVRASLETGVFTRRRSHIFWKNMHFHAAKL